MYACGCTCCCCCSSNFQTTFFPFFGQENKNETVPAAHDVKSFKFYSKILIPPPPLTLTSMNDRWSIISFTAVVFPLYVRIIFHYKRVATSSLYGFNISCNQVYSIACNMLYKTAVLKSRYAYHWWYAKGIFFNSR